MDNSREFYEKRRASGVMICVECGSFSSARTCHACNVRNTSNIYKLDNGQPAWTTTWTSSDTITVVNPFSSSNVMSAEMKEQEAKQRRVEDGRPDEVKDILRKLGYNVR